MVRNSIDQHHWVSDGNFFTAVFRREGEHGGSSTGEIDGAVVVGIDLVYHVL